MKRIAVTGATGAIGLALISLCVENDVEVFAFVRKDSGRLDRIPDDPRVHQVYCGLDDMASFDVSGIPPIDVFYHFAWMKTFGAEARDDLHTQIRNTDYAVDAVELAHRLGCSLFIGAGSQAEYGRVDGVLTPGTPTHPENGYGMAKLAAGLMTGLQCEKLGMEHIWTRILSVYGPGDGDGTLVMSVIRDALAGRDPECTGAEQIWDYLYSKDAGEAMYLVGKRGVAGKIYLIANGASVVLRDHIDTICDVCASSEGGVRVEPRYGARPYGAKQVMHLEADISELTEDTGFVPKTSFSTGIEETVRWVKGQDRDV